MKKLVVVIGMIIMVVLGATGCGLFTETKEYTVKHGNRTVSDIVISEHYKDGRKVVDITHW